MPIPRIPPKRLVSVASAVALTILALVTLWAVWPPSVQAGSMNPADQTGGFVLKFANADRGRALFTGKGCIICHSINGVGGKAGPALDASSTDPSVDIFEFSARMWRGASTMIVLQEMELGYQIEFTGQELADIARFVHDLEAQRNFSENDIPELIRGWMVDETYDELDIEEMVQ